MSRTDRIHLTLAACREYRDAHPDLHAEYRRRREAGEAFAEGEPVTAYMREYLRLDRIAARAAGA